MQLIEFWFISYAHYKWLKMAMWSPFWRFNSYIMECLLHQNEDFKMKSKVHNFFQISTFLDCDFSTLIENGINFEFSQELCAKSSGKLTCLKRGKFQSWLFPFKNILSWRRSCHFFLFIGTKITKPYSFLCAKRLGWWTLVSTSKVLRPQPQLDWPLWNICVTNNHG